MLTKSPKRKVKSPKRKVKSPKRKVKSPKRKVKSPKRKVKSPKRKVKSPKTIKKTIKKTKKKTVKNPRGLIVGHLGKKTDYKGVEYYVYTDRDFDKEIKNTIINIQNNKDLSEQDRKYMYDFIREMETHSKRVIAGIEVPVKWIELYNESYKKLFPNMMLTSYEMNKRLTALAY